MSREIAVGTGIPGHVVDRCDWRCVLCDQPWPCAPAKVHLGEQYADDRLALVMVMCDYLFDAVVVYLASPRELHERFIAWTRYPRAGDLGST